ncbi:MAG: carboxylating nicotinate-nucleotide diphosphorylase [Alphaproteobacteria bacterium]|nr:carboxylating nicotinate-nucleotide diphosphorylase [Alphaproteobacteria bacterium]MBM3732469.1 carboxylating nicotinate-nucleotide diphosphorylase [Acidimicrobiia bacterium]
MSLAQGDIANDIADDIERVIDAALAEDVGRGDITTRAIVPAGAQLALVMRTRQAIVLAGIAAAARVFRRLDPEAKFEILARDGERFYAGATLARVEGDAAALLTAERTALNLVQFMSGIATLTRAYVDRIAGTRARLLDTRKTVPGLRALSKYATRMGGATNHRMRLDDGILIKDNHVAIAGGIAEAVRHARTGHDGIRDVRAECDTLDQVRDAIAAGADSILLDNMDVATLREAVRLVAGRVPLEASGGVTLENIRAIADTGVDFISTGRITQSAPSVDIGLDVAD